MWWLTKVLLIVLTISFIHLLVGSELTQLIWLSLMGFVFLVCGAVLMRDPLIWIYRTIRFMDWRQHRHGGLVFGIIGFCAIAIAGSNENLIDTPILHTILLAGSGVALLGVAWLINHWPTRSIQTRQQ